MARKSVSGSGDTTVKIWDVVSGNELESFNGHTDYVTSVAFSPDGKRVVSGSNDKTIRTWAVGSGGDSGAP